MKPESVLGVDDVDDDSAPVSEKLDALDTGEGAQPLGETRQARRTFRRLGGKAIEFQRQAFAHSAQPLL
ncbi:MAG: hypothetical protein M3R13_09230 [Armatimonadota bacterium]|nr:hypothetical protein [Armatimonadota bacterium]